MAATIISARCLRAEHLARDGRMDLVGVCSLALLLLLHTAPGGLPKTRAGAHSRICDSLKASLRICISPEALGDADSPGPDSTLGEARYCYTAFLM